jgi:hypothetical protein
MNNEFIIRVGSFLAAFLLVAMWEFLSQRRSLTTSKKNRWISNLGITFLNPLVLRLGILLNLLTGWR